MDLNLSTVIFVLSCANNLCIVLFRESLRKSEVMRVYVTFLVFLGLPIAETLNGKVCL